MSEKKKVETVDAAKVLEGVRGVVPPPSFGALFDGPLRGFWTSSGGGRVRMMQWEVKRRRWETLRVAG